MRNFNIMAAFAATLMIGSVASAKDKPSQPKEKKICKTEADSTSRIGAKRVCRTKEEWSGMGESQRRSVEGARNRN